MGGVGRALWASRCSCIGDSSGRVGIVGDKGRMATPVSSASPSGPWDVDRPSNVGRRPKLKVHRLTSSPSRSRLLVRVRIPPSRDPEASSVPSLVPDARLVLNGSRFDHATVRDPLVEAFGRTGYSALTGSEDETERTRGKNVSLRVATSVTAAVSGLGTLCDTPGLPVVAWIDSAAVSLVGKPRRRGGWRNKCAFGLTNNDGFASSTPRAIMRMSCKCRTTRT